MNQIILLNSFKDLCNHIKCGDVNNPFTIYSPKFVISHETRNYYNTDYNTDYPYHSIRIWKSNTLFNCWYNDFSSSDFVAALDYIIRPNDLKIDYMNVNDDPYNIKQLDPIDSMIIHHELLEYIKNIAKKENKKKVIIDVHSNLRIYNKYYKNEGFQATERKAEDHPYWRESEFILSD